MKDNLHDPRIDSAIESLPIAELPQGFTENLMQQVQLESRETKQAQPENKFLFSALWLFAISFLATLYYLINLGIQGTGSANIQTIGERFVNLTHTTPPEIIFAYSVIIGIGLLGILFSLMSAVFLVERQSF